MPYLRDVAHDGWLGIQLLYNNSWKFHQLAAMQLLSGQPVRYGKGRWYCPSITYKITPAGSLFSSQQGGPSCWASPLAFGLIGCHGRQCSSLSVFTEFAHRRHSNKIWNIKLYYRAMTRLCKSKSVP
jgi:hypothetical protein